VADDLASRAPWIKLEATLEWLSRNAVKLSWDGRANVAVLFAHGRRVTMSGNDLCRVLPALVQAFRDELEGRPPKTRARTLRTDPRKPPPAGEG
jgi:hypothetical protein